MQLISAFNGRVGCRARPVLREVEHWPRLPRGGDRRWNLTGLMATVLSVSCDEHPSLEVPTSGRLETCAFRVAYWRDPVVSWTSEQVLLGLTGKKKLKVG